MPDFGVSEIERPETMTANELSIDEIQYIFRHMFLPPKLPESDDYDDHLDQAILQVTLDSLIKFKQYVSVDPDRTMVDAVCDLLEQMNQILTTNGYLNSVNLKNSLRNLSKTGGTLLLHIRAQNAGVMITVDENNALFEVFELSPDCHQVVRTKGRLKRTFPGIAVDVPRQVLCETDFQQSISSTLAKMSGQGVPGTLERIRKAGEEHDEDRNTRHPKAITEFFTNVIRAVGKDVRIIPIWKNTREEVLWNDARSPWWRSALWLLIRVGLQLTFTRHGSEKMYKYFIVFLLSHILDLAARHSLDGGSITTYMESDALFTMQAKIGRRLLKIGTDANVMPGLGYVREAMNRGTKELESRWDRIIHEEKFVPRLEELKLLEFPKDIWHSLPELDSFIGDISLRKRTASLTSFNPTPSLRTFTVENIPEGPGDASPHDARIWELHSVEWWVESCLDGWLLDRLQKPDTCKKLYGLLRRYYGGASSCYSGNPEAMSLMLLTVVEIWVACDKSAVFSDRFDLLKDYDPGVPAGEFLRTLLLPFKSQMKRLEKIERYLRLRRDSSIFKDFFIFTSFGQPESYSVRYFNRSRDLQELKSQIESQSARDRIAKLGELRQKKNKYTMLMNLHRCTEHHNYCRFHSHRIGQNIDMKCPSCKYLAEANNLKIIIHEWPLPANEDEAKSTVFEFCLPQWFGNWRDATVFLLLDVFNEQTAEVPECRPNTKASLFQYPGLIPFARIANPSMQRTRVGLFSKTKPHYGTHRKKKTINLVSDTDICLLNGMKYSYLDYERVCFLRIPLDHRKTTEACTYLVPFNLRRYLFRPYTDPDGKSPNTVIADQHLCPGHVSCGEFKALASLPFGVRIQWKNILLQLAQPVVDFRKEETALFVLQIINQAGPPAGSDQQNSHLRQAHMVCGKPSFSKKILEHVGEKIQQIKKSLECSNALVTLICLARRVLELTSDKEVKIDALALLLVMRQVATGWMKDLEESGFASDTDNKHNQLKERWVYIALICLDTFNVSNEYLWHILDNPKNARTLFRCSMVAHADRQFVSHQSSVLFRLLASRKDRLLYRMHPKLLNLITESDRSSLDGAIEEVWSAYVPGSRWERKAKHWLESTTQSRGERQGLQIDYDVLTGEFLVQGTPLAILPEDYRDNAMYKKIFRNKSVDVMPSDIPGLRFSSKKKFNGYSLHFGMTESNNLLLRFDKGDEDIFELIPPRVFNNRIPSSFIHEFIPVYHTGARRVEMKPIRRFWEALADKTWVFEKVRDVWCLGKDDDKKLISLQSPTSIAISNILWRLDEIHNFHTWLYPKTGSLGIELPNLKLGFHLDPCSGELKSHQFPGFIVDKCQDIGSLIGFKNKLVLTNPSTGERRVVVVENEIATKRNYEKLMVYVTTPARNFHVYAIDDKLRRFIDTGDLQSKLYIAYLHALTSFCLPDPFTQKTGTEQALEILRSASVRSFDVFTQENVSLLQRISAVTPRRAFYPLYEKAMERVTWHNTIGFLAQHGYFALTAQSLLEEYEKLDFLYPVREGLEIPSVMKGIDTELNERYMIRSAFLHGWHFGGECFTCEKDQVYTARDTNPNSRNGRRAFIQSSMLLRKQVACTKWNSNLPSRIWELYLSKQVNLELPPDSEPLEYDSWLLSGKRRSCASDAWIGLHCYFDRWRARLNKYQIIIWLASQAFACESESDFEIIQVISCLFSIPGTSAILSSFSSRLAKLSAGEKTVFFPPNGREFKRSQLEDMLFIALKKNIDSSPIDRLAVGKKKGEDKDHDTSGKEREKSWYDDRLGYTVIRDLVSTVEQQWLNEDRSSFTRTIGRQLDRHFDNSVTNAITRTIKQWYDNACFYDYIEKLVVFLCRYQFQDIPVPPGQQKEGTLNPRINEKVDINIEYLMEHTTPKAIPQLTDSSARLNSIPKQGRSNSSSEYLLNLIASLEREAVSVYEVKYVKELEESARALLEYQADPDLPVEKWSKEIERALYHFHECSERDAQAFYDCITATISPRNPGHIQISGDTLSIILANSHLWPRLPPTVLLCQLRSSRYRFLRREWKQILVQYCYALRRLQRAERLINSFQHRHHDAWEFAREFGNWGHEEWESLADTADDNGPESLLLEVESGLLIRDVQHEIADEMRDPRAASKKKNAVMQLNMGEGKSSVIVPLVAASLADGERLVRVVVAKPQAQQMFSMLVSKLGGLLNRRVYRLPVSRSMVKTNTSGSSTTGANANANDVRIEKGKAEKIVALCKQCASTRGIMLVQPEHILALHLQGIEMLISCKTRPHNQLVSDILLENHFWLESTARDIFDESDDIFSPKFELSYTMGDYEPVQLSPTRWRIVQQVFGAVSRCASEAWQRFPDQMELFFPNPRGRFPRLRVHGPDADRCLLEKVAWNICDHKVVLDEFPIATDPNEVYSYIMTEHGVKEDYVDHFSTTKRDVLLLLRGLFVGGVMSFSLSKRWRVNYGLADRREQPTKLAVPYRAKDNPTPRSEFSHTDVVICLTCLSYYYYGLSDGELFTSFEHLSHSDQSDREYSDWIWDAQGLPTAYQQLVGVNLQDKQRCLEEIFPHLRYSKTVIDFFLDKVVFPRGMKEFPEKLSASGWDIGRAKAHPTTGFSGTKDSKVTLPLAVEQLDMAGQKHTNALVLKYLLQPENSVIPISEDDSKSDADKLLDLAASLKPKVRVILDVGAQVLELNNREMAFKWLKRAADDSTTQAAVFVDDNDNVCVINHQGHVQHLQSSPFARNLEACLVFLDDAHTRGIDISLPNYYRAIVTLGANLTKDRLVQACMRMRKLGHGQSVIFCVPREIKVKIHARRQVQDNAPIDVAEVLSWAVSQTWAESERNTSLWAGQGRRFIRHSQLWNRARQEGKLSAELALAFLEPESQTLAQRYQRTSGLPVTGAQTLDSDEEKQILARCEEMRNKTINTEHTKQLMEEQEREITEETEQEQHVELPDKAKPAEHKVHPDLLALVRTGRLHLLPESVEPAPAFIPAFIALRSTRLGKLIDLFEFPTDLLVTTDYATTVDAFATDLYQRPIQWVLATVNRSATIERLIVLSPFEANELHPAIAASPYVSLRLYSPRTNRGYKSIDHLGLDAVGADASRQSILPASSRLTMLLNIFAGQLYFGSYEEYISTCRFLGLVTANTSPGTKVAEDGFIISRTDVEGDESAGFSKSPVAAIRELMLIRCDGGSVEKSHVGKMLGGKLLDVGEFSDP